MTHGTSKLAVQAVGLGKMYHIGVQQERYRTLRDSLADALLAPVRRAAKLLRGQATGAAELDQTIWALKDVSFEVRHGEVVGIIGKNGAGKSTLLKILSRITEPTEGYAQIRGRVASLLEVGTGFHPELTGRENIFLNGAILGMRKAEIESKFDEIVAFAEIPKFIDTPVKHYSSGMYVRLAFAVAAHLEPEILVVDEVLSVGDASFQAKCLGKMSEVAGSGRTVLFVSHNMGAVTDLCERALLLEDGRVTLSGTPPEVVGAYLSRGVDRTGVWVCSDDAKDGDDSDLRIRSVRVLSTDREPTGILPFDSPFLVEITYDVCAPSRGIAVYCGVSNYQGLVWQSWDTDGTEWGGRVRAAGTYTSICRVPARLLKPGRYQLNVGAHVPGVRLLDARVNLLAFDISEVGFPFRRGRTGAVTPLLEWTVERQDGAAAAAGPRLARAADRTGHA